MPAWLVAPGFWGNGAVHTALLVGLVAAVVSAVVGTFAVIRGQSFAGHALADVGAAGGAAAFLAGVNQLAGFVAVNVVAAAAMELAGRRSPRTRDVATGVVLGAALGLSALFLALVSRTSATTGAAFNVFFGSVFTFPASLAPWVVALGAGSLGVIGLLWRPLLLASAQPDLARARRIPVRAVGACFLAALALAVSLSAVTIGAILSTALLVGPAASALRLTARPGRAVVLAAAIGAAATFLGILLAYDSATWGTPSGWPVSFFVVALCVLAFVVADATTALRRRRRAVAA